VYLKHYETMREAREGLTAYFRFYNTERPHQALGHRTPAEVYEAAGAPIPAAA
jgi:putative transposase